MIPEYDPLTRLAIAAQHDPVARDRLLVESRDRAYAKALRVLAAYDADEVAQNTVVKLCGCLHRFNSDIAPYRVFLGVVVHTMIAEHFRRLKRDSRIRTLDIEPVSPSDSNDPVVLAQLSEIDEQIRREIDGLNPDEQAIIHARLCTDLTFAQLAEIKQQNPTKIANTFYRAIAKLRRAS